MFDSTILNDEVIDSCLFEENMPLSVYINVDYDENDLEYPTGNEPTSPTLEPAKSPSPDPTKCPTLTPTLNQLTMVMIHLTILLYY